MPISARTAINATIGLLGLAFLILAGIVGMNIWLSGRVEVYSKIIIENRDIRTSAVDLRSALQTAESSQRGFLILGNEVYLAPFDSAKLAAKREIERLRSLLETPEQRQPMLSRLSASVGEKFAEMEQTVSLKKENQNDKALELFRTNRGKVLMDEINVFLSSIIRNVDANMTATVVEQKSNTNKLQLASSLGGLLILMIVGAVIYVGVRYTSDIAEARDEVTKLNTTLEQRVERRTQDLGRALSRAEVLLSEVNHRVANSLSLVASLVRLQAKSVSDAGAKAALAETESRIFAIADVHKRLYNSGDVEVVALNEYLEDLLKRLDGTMKQEGLGAIVRTDFEPIELTPDASVNVGVVLNEWVTNAFKYAYPNGGGEIRVTLKRLDKDHGELVVEDDGVGFQEGVVKGTGLGSKLVTAMASNLKGEVRYAAMERGTSARMAFPILA
jgi:two-component sensor histidine kinase